MRAESLSIAYGGKLAVDSVDLPVRQGEVLALIGPSGCGKTTLLRSLNRLVELTPSATRSGRITLDGQDIDALEVTQLRRRVSMVFQQPNPFPMSIFDNVAYALREQGSRRPSRDELRPAVVDALQRAGLLDEVGENLMHPALRLSGGQQQRLCIARALAARPEVLLLDEPCSALDPRSTATIEELIMRLREEVAVVIVTHNLQQALRVADHVGFMYLGELVEYGPAEQSSARRASSARRNTSVGVRMKRLGPCSLSCRCRCCSRLRVHADKSARLEREGGGALDEKGVVVTRKSPDVKVVSPAPCRTRTALPWQCGCATPAAARSRRSPITIDVRDGGRKRLFRNDDPGLEPTLVRVPLLRPGEDFDVGQRPGRGRGAAAQSRGEGGRGQGGRGAAGAAHHGHAAAARAGSGQRRRGGRFCRQPLAGGAAQARRVRRRAARAGAWWRPAARRSSGCNRASARATRSSSSATRAGAEHLGRGAPQRGWEAADDDPPGT